MLIDGFRYYHYSYNKQILTPRTNGGKVRFGSCKWKLQLVCKNKLSDQIFYQPHCFPLGFRIALAKCYRLCMFG